MKRPIIFIAILTIFAFAAQARELPEEIKQKIDLLVNTQLQAEAFPGAQVAVGDRSGIIYRKNYGWLDYDREKRVNDSTLYDIASCTKALSTTFVLMNLYDRGLIKLEERIGDILPRFADTDLRNITVAELLTHTSGIGYKPIYPRLVKNVNEERLLSVKQSEKYPYLVDRNTYMACEVFIAEHFTAPGLDSVLINIAIEAYKPERKGRYSYTDSNFYILKLIAEKRGGARLDVLTDSLMRRIECTHTLYNPCRLFDVANMAPTEDDYLLRRGPIRGEVHDETAYIAEGVGGNAGLFSTASDMARFCEMLLGRGIYKSIKVIEPETVDLFTSSPLAARGLMQGYGFDKRAKSTGALGGGERFGHTGFTGTIFWIDKKLGIYMVFLSNSVYPTRTNRRLAGSQLRLKIWETLVE